MTDAQRHLVQRALAHLGYYDGTVDGIFGPDTRAAIRRWQHEEHQPMTGHLTAQEASKLASTWD
jgi:peptidoglycan hydrolase-like protein with peptidoglycan-binding domain